MVWDVGVSIRHQPEYLPSLGQNKGVLVLDEVRFNQASA